jgi:hypothetical protein
MRASGTGSVGPGVYFCPRPSDCAVKALQLQDPESVLVSVQVPITHIDVVGEFTSNYDSHASDVLYLRGGSSRPGPEFVIKNVTKIELLGMFKYDTALGQNGYDYRHPHSLSFRRSREEDFQIFNQCITFGQVVPTPFSKTDFDLVLKTRKGGSMTKLIDYMPKCPTRGCSDTSLLHNIQFVHDGIRCNDVNSDALTWVVGPKTYQTENPQPRHKHGFLGNKKTPVKRKTSKSKRKTSKSKRKM